MNEMQDSDSEFSDSSGSVTSSSSSSSESTKNDNSLELAKICGQTLHLPKGLCENEDIFKEFFSLDTWNQVPSNFQAFLKNKFLPVFPEGANNEMEQTKTIKMLFNNEINSFNKSPLSILQKNLEDGNYRPDLIKIRESIEKSKRIENKFKECERVSKLSKTLMISREKLLRAAYNTPPGEQIKVDRTLHDSTNILDGNVAGLRAKKRYYDEITSLAKQIGLSDCSDDEIKEGEELLEADNFVKKNLGNFPLHPANELKIIGTMTKRGRFNGSSITDFKVRPAGSMHDNHLRQMLFTHKRRKMEEPDRPEFETSDVRLIDINNRVEMTGSNYRKEILAPPKIRKVITKSIPSMNSGNITAHKNQFSLLKKSQLINNGNSNQQLNKQQSLLKSVVIPTDQKNTVRPQKEQITSNAQLSSESENEINVDVLNTNPPTIRSMGINNPKQKPNITRDSNEDLIKKPKIVCKKPGSVAEHYNQRINNIENKDVDKKCMDNGFTKIHPMSIDDLDGIDMINLPVSLTDTVLNEETVVHDANHYTLDTKNNQGMPIIRKARQEQQTQQHDSNTDIPQQQSNITISPELMQETHACYLSLIRDIFCSTPDHRMKLDELKSKIHLWLSNPITALNDWYNQADNWLNLLPSAIHFLSGEFADQPEEFVPYIEFKTQLNIYQWIGAGRDSDSHLLNLCQYWLSRKHEMGIKPSKPKVEKVRAVESKTYEYEDNLINEKPLSPPPPRCPTNWTVQPANAEEIEEFRVQERQRFENPHKAFTYRMYGYESVVGPVKGVYTQILALTKARGHNMLTADRPNFVTILTLVRDATARLPNGEGTRADICELLKCSQYINPQASDNILQTIVSGALDRMHVEIDPCVRYDAKRKIWIYLHRNRTEEEFERVHQQYQGVTKNQKKSTTRKLKHKQLKSENSLLIQNQHPAKPQAILPPLSVCGQFQISQGQHNITQQAITNSISNSIQNVNPLTNKTQTISQNSPQVAVVAPLKISPQKGSGNMAKPELVPLKTIQPQLILDTEQDIDDAVVDLNETTTFLVQKQFSQKLLNSNNKTISVASISPNVAGHTPIKHLHLQQNQKLIGSSNQSGTNLINSVINQQCGTTEMKSQIISPISSSLPQQILASPTQQPQQTISASNTQFIVTNKTNKTGKPILIQSTNNNGQQVITQIRPSNAQGQQQGFIIPLNSDQFQAISNQLPQVSSNSNQSALISSSANSPKLLKSATITANQVSPPALTAVSRPATIIQQTNPITGKQQFIRIATTSAAGKSLLNQNQITVHQQPKIVNNLQLEVDTGDTSSGFNQEGSATNVQQKISTGTVMIRPQLTKTALTTGLSLINNQNVRITQPRQILQVQQKQPLQKSGLLQQNALVISGNQQNQQIQTKNVILQQQTSQQAHQLQQQTAQTQQVQKIINVSAANLQNLITATTQGQTNIISPQIIQLHPPTSSASANGSGTAKIQTFNANILPNFKTQNIRLQSPISTQGNQQQPIIIKQQMLQQIQQKQNIGISKNTGTVSIGTNSNKISGKNVPSLTTTNIITANSSSLAPGTIIQTSPQTIVKHSNIIQQQNKQFTIVSSPQQLQQQQSQTVTRVVKSLSSGVGNPVLQSNQIVQTSVGNVVRTQNSTGNPVMAKVITNNTGQIISLESLLQKQGIAPGTTLRVAGTKSGQTNIIQLTNQQQSNSNNNNNIVDGITQPVTQYAVVSQGRNLISMTGTPQRLITTQASNTVVTNLANSTVSNVKTVSSISASTATSSGNQIPVQSVSKIINANQLTPQQIVSAKVLGKNNTSNIRMNLANLRGKPVIITNKQGTQQNNTTAQNVQLVQNNQVVNSANSTSSGNIVIGGQTLKVQGNMIPGNIQVLNQSSSQPQAVMLGNQILKVAQSPNVRQTVAANIISSSINNRTNTLSGTNTLTSIASTNSGTMVVNSSNTVVAGISQNTGGIQNKTVVLGSTGQPIRVQSGQIQTVAIGNSNNSSGIQQQNQQIILGHPIKGTPLKTTGQQRVVLAVQGGGQILLPPGFQGGSLNLKSLQGLKVVQVGQQNQQQTIQQSQQQNKGKN
ncbi:nuclear factor related to kappa-B-binding protein [Condylostylus longicornis]|uniref:nuclear factor related to kappa-B-binding protein n=1 Tax=Condylostylus longicornis TaxID=2530218 RepID=UPI00244DC468|nr:nuclear factor related to kappa-B-binding protein [Condylostylus longicornis]